MRSILAPVLVLAMIIASSCRSPGEKELREAVCKEDPSNIQKPLDGGADANAKTTDGWTSLHMASKEGNIAVVELLLGKGADVNMKTTGGWTPLHFASQERSYHCG